MSVSIHQIALHQVLRQGENDVKLLINDHLLDPENPSVLLLMQSLHRHFTYKAKQFAYFAPESVFPKRLMDLETELQTDPEAFLTFSKQQMDLLAQALQEDPKMEAGTIVFCHYRHLSQHYIMLAFLSSCLSLNVDQSMSLAATHYLDIEHTDRIAQINLTELKKEADSQRYLAILKGRIGRKVVDFFLTYLNAQEGVDMKEQNRLLNQSIESYCQKMDLSTEEKQAAKEQIYEYGKTQWQQGEEMTLSDVSQQLPAKETLNFQQFVGESALPLQQKIAADKTVLRQLTRYMGSGSGLNISFDSQLLGDRIHWDQENDRLIIEKLPPNLKDQLLKKSQS